MAASTSAWAWGDVGHEIICILAWRDISRETRGQINHMLESDPRFNSLAEACTFADPASVTQNIMSTCPATPRA